MNKVMEVLTRKVGPIPVWAWTLLVAMSVAAYMLYRRNQGISTTGMKADGTAETAQPSGASNQGEFQSATSVEKVDPETGESYQSSYSASGSTPVTPGNVGLLGGYPVNFSPGDVYVNYPGQTTSPGNPNGSVTLPTYRPAKYPPKIAQDTGGTGPVPGSKYMGSYWFTPQNKYDLEHLISRAYDLPTKEENLTPTLSFWYAVMYDRIRDANPQIDWTSQIPIGTPLYIPLEGAGARGDRTAMPSYASRQGPSNYVPPPQQTVMQVAYK